jgi:hypothetical protein
MADTIVDPAPPAEPVPPTERDPQPAQAAPPASPSRARRIVLFVVLAILVLAAAGVAGLYLFVFRYEPTARKHVPAQATLAMRIEAADIITFGPVRKHLLPILLEGGAQGSNATKADRSKRILELTGVHLPADLREIVMASMDGVSWVVCAGGRLTPGKFVAGMAELAREEGWAGFHLDGDVLVGPHAAIAQADDGTLIFGTDAAIVRTALPATEEGTRMGLPVDGALTFAITKNAWEALADKGNLLPHAASLRAIERAGGSFRLGSSPELSLRLMPADASKLPGIESDVRALLGELNLVLLLSPDVAGEKTALRGATVKIEGNGVVLQAPWPYEALDRGAERLASLLRARNDGEERRAVDPPAP